MVLDKVNVLLLEDNATEAWLIRELLSAASQYPGDYPGFEIECTGYLREGLARLAADEAVTPPTEATVATVDVVLFNLRLLDSDQWDTFTALQPYAQQTPLIMLTGYAEEAWGLRAVQQGAQDYLPKDELTGRLLARSILYAIERHHLETELRQHRDHLEEQVAARTAELEVEVAAHRRAAEALRASEQKFKLVTETIEDVFWMSTRGVGEMLYISPAYETLWQRSRESLYQSPQSFLDAIHPDDLDTYLAVIDTYHQKGIAYDCGYRIIRDDGEIRWIHERGYPVSHALDAPPLMAGVCTDITTWKQAEEARIESEELFRKSFDTEHVAMAISRRRDGMYIEANPGFLEVTGYTYDEIVGHNSQELNFFSPSQRQILIKNLNEHGRLRNQELTFPTKEGDLRTILFSIGPIVIRGEDCLLATMVDITARKRAEIALQESEGKYRELLNSMNDEIAVIDPNFRVVQTNLALERDTGKDPDIIGDHCFAAFYGFEAPCEWCPAQRALATGKTQEATVPLPADAPQQWFHLSASLIRNTQGEITHVVEAARDITVLKQAEEELEEYAAKLQRSNEDLQQFATTVSHDLQAPLRRVIRFLGLLEEHYRSELDAEVQEYIDFAVTGAQQMRHLIRDLLQYSRIDSRGQAPAPTATAPLVDNILQTLQFQITDCGAEVTHDPLPEVYADATQVRQLFQNLLDNALKFRRPEVPPRIHITAERQDDQWQFAVRDNGIGIAPAYHEEVFQVFRRLHTAEEYEGTGVGLAICRKIVERHGGRMWLASAEGQGATLYFTLPVVPEKQN
jgi:PAS domain S-box-containing protein